MGTEEPTLLPTVLNEESAMLSPGLRKLLIEGEDSGGACRLIALNKTLRAECERMLPVLEERKQPATDIDAVKVIARRMVAYGITSNAAQANSVTWESYLTALEGLPVHAIEDAFDRWDRGEGVKDIAAAGFPPRPPQLALLALQAKQDIFTAVYRAKKALAHVEKIGVEWTPERKAAERQKMIDLGYLTPDGKPNMSLKAREFPRDDAPRQTPQQMAEALRRTDAQARQGGAPISRSHIAEPVADPGDVI